MTRITLSGVGKRYGAAVAVEDLSLVIESGHFVTLLGPSGSGKTTTLRMIAGLERPSSGEITIGDQLVSGPGVFVPTFRRRLGMVFQSYAVWPHKTVFGNVAFPLEQLRLPKEERSERVYAILKKAGLSGLEKRYPSQLSGGQQQRVSLARALVGNPSVILFDEPLSNLDAKLRDSMRDLLQQLHRELKLTSVYVTHDQTEALVLSDRVHVMNFGKLVQSGQPRELYNAPSNIFVAQFIGQVNAVKIPPEQIDGSSVIFPGDRLIKVVRPMKDVSENVLLIRPHKIQIVDMTVTQNTLDGIIRTETFLGDRLHLVVEVPECGDFIVEQVEGERELPSIGSTIRLHLPEAACALI